jgi:hypothetical protein
MKGSSIVSRPNAKHERFAQLLADGLPQHVAYSKAGLAGKNPRSASTMLLKRNVSIGERVEAILNERSSVRAKGIAKAIETTAMDETWVLEQLREVAAMAKAARPVLNSKGEPIGEYQANLGAANRALELIGKQNGMFIERKEIRTGLVDDWPRDEIKDFRTLVREIHDSTESEATGAIARAGSSATSRTSG